MPRTRATDGEALCSQPGMSPSVAARGDLAYEIDHHQQNHRAGEGDHQTQTVLIGGIGTDYGRQQPSARQPADDAD